MNHISPPKKHYVPILSLSIAALTAGAAPALAQSTGDFMLEEIVVTAQKRQESAQDTPISISVVSGADLSANAQNSLDDVLSDVAGVNIQGSSQGKKIYIRGVGSSIDPVFADSAVALMVDGVYNGRTEVVGAGAFDIDRVEVLRGPQGTLYGRNATGGAVNVITAQPILGEVIGSLRSQVGNYDSYRVELAQNVPLSDTSAIRLAVLREQHSGYVDDGSYDADIEAYRASVLWEPSDVFNVVAKAEYYRDGGVGANTLPVEGSAGNLAIGAAGSYLLDENGNALFPDGWIANSNDPWSNNPEHTPGTTWNEAYNFSLDIDWDLGFATATFLPSYTENINGAASSFLFGSLNADNSGTYTGNDDEYYINESNMIYTSFEARLASNGEGQLEYVAGVYVLESKNTESTYGDETDLSDGTGVLEFLFESVPSKTYALFGQANYSFTDTFRLNLGLRVSRDVFGSNFSAQVRDSVGNAQGGPDAVNFSTEQDSTLYKLGFEWDVLDESMVYAHVSTGFKQGGITTTLPAIEFDPEELTAYEIGLKSRLLDGRLQFNSAVYHYDYSNYQYAAFTFVPVGSYGATAMAQVVTNAGDTTISGLEFAADYLLTPKTKLGLNANFMDANYGEATLPSNPFVGNDPFSLEGRQIQNSPDWAGNISIEQAVPLSSGEITLLLSAHFTDGYYITHEQYLPGAYQEGYTKTDLNIGYTPDSEVDWNVNFWVKNLENDQQTTALWPAYRRLVSEPRTFGISAQVNY